MANETKKIGRAFTKEETRSMFVTVVRRMAKDWANTKTDPQEIADGVAFSILSMLDGSNAALPGFLVIPDPADEDKDWCSERGINYFPQTPEFLKGTDVCDIAGSLHELYHSKLISDAAYQEYAKSLYGVPIV